jgi:hypothetical protein
LLGNPAWRQWRRRRRGFSNENRIGSGHGAPHFRGAPITWTFDNARSERRKHGLLDFGSAIAAVEHDDERTF